MDSEHSESLTFRRYQEQDFASYAELYETVYGKTMDVDFFRWKHRQNRVPPEELIIFLVINAKEQVIGANSFFPETYVTSAQNADGTAAPSSAETSASVPSSQDKLRVVQSGDTMVHPDYRGRGIFMKILAYAAQELQAEGYAAIFGFANGNSYPGFLKFGFADLGRIPVYYKILNWSQFLRSKGSVAQFAGRLLDTMRSFLQLFRFSQAASYAVSRVKLTEESILTFLERENRSALHPLKTAAYLQWKYEKKPQGSYQTWAVTKNAECVAVFVVRVERHGEGLAAEIVEGAATPEDASAALQVLLQRLQDGFQFIRIWESNDESLQQGILKNRFLKREAALYFIMKPLQENQDDLTQRRLWEVIGGNADTV